jgi:ATP-binding cassette, subfamily B, bacterial MsbA
LSKIPAFLIERIPYLNQKGGPWPLIIRLFRESGKKHTAGYIVATVFMGLVALTSALSAWILRDVVDQVFVDQDIAALSGLVVAVIVISLVRGISLYGSTVTLTRVGNAIIAENQKKVFDHILGLGMNYFDRTHSSDLIAAVSVRAQAAGQLLNTIMTSFVRDLFSVIGLVLVMVIQSPWMSLIVLVIGPIAILGVNRLIRKMRDSARMEFAGMTQIIASMQETTHGMRIVKAFNLESAMRTRMNRAIETVRQRGNKIGAIKAQTSPLMETLGGFAIAGVMLWAGYQTMFEGVKPGAFVSFVAAILLAYEPAKRLANTRVGIERGVVGVKFIYNILDTKPTLNTNPDGPELEVTRGEVAFNDVNFAYRKKSPPVLTKFNFVAPAGKVTALVGPSGSGKSTIISLIERFYDVQSGAITIDGQDISTVRLGSLHDRLALVSQDTVIFEDTVRENIRYGRPSATDEEVEKAARNAMAHDFIMALKNGYDQELDDAGKSLSGGQRQRIAIARAMLRDAPIILLDEATSSLDSESENQVQIAFDRLMKNRTTIVIAHRLSTVVSADQICVLVRGNVVESGRHAELIAAGKHYARLYYLQFEKHNDGEVVDDPEREKVALTG